MVLKTSEALQANKDFLSFPSALDWQIESELFDSVQFSGFFLITSFEQLGYNVFFIVFFHSFFFGAYRFVELNVLVNL